MAELRYQNPGVNPGPGWERTGVTGQGNRGKNPERYADDVEWRRVDSGGSSAASQEAGKPSWVKEEHWSKSDQEAANAYKSIMGSEIDAGTVAEYRSKLEGKSGFKLDDFMRHWANTDQARDNGINPEDYGVRAREGSKLKGTKKVFYDAWRGANPNKAFTNADDEYLQWEIDATGGKVDAFNATLKGEIQSQTQYDEKTGSLQSFKVVTPQAIDTMGGSYLYKGNDPGDITFTPTGTKLGSKNTQEVIRSEDGYDMLYARGNPDDGLLGGTFLEKAIPKEIFESGVLDVALYMVNPALGATGGIVTPVIFGRDAADKRYAGLESTFGIAKEDIQKIEGVGQAIATGALAMGGPLGIAGAAAINVASAKASTINNASIDSADAFEQAAINTGVLAAGARYGTPGLIVAGAGAQAYSGADAGEIAEGAAWTAAGGVARDYALAARVLIDDDYDVADAFISAGTSLATQAASGQTSNRTQETGFLDLPDFSGMQANITQGFVAPANRFIDDITGLYTPEPSPFTPADEEFVRRSLPENDLATNPGIQAPNIQLTP